MKTFKKKWNNRSIEDAGAWMSKEGRSFAMCFYNMLKRTLKPHGIAISKFTIGHYYVSGFLADDPDDEIYVYFSYSIPRGGLPVQFNDTRLMNSVLYRTAENINDCTGGTNNYSSIEDFPESVIKLFETLRSQTRKIYVTVERKTMLGYEKEITRTQFARLKNGDTLESVVPDLYEQIEFDFSNLAPGDLCEDYAIEDEQGHKIQDWNE